MLIGSDPVNNLQANGFYVYEEMINLSKAGIDNYPILKSATVNASKFLMKAINGEVLKWVKMLM